MKNLRRKPDFNQFLKVLKRQGKPSYLPFYEHIASPGFIARRTETKFDKMTVTDADYWKIYVGFWLGLGFDCMPMEIPLNCPLADTLQDSAVTHGSEALAVFKNRAEFEKYEWPPLSSPLDFIHFETVAELLPDGMKIVGGVCGGPYEWISQMMGVLGLSYAIMEDPEFVEHAFQKIGALHNSALQQIATMEGIGALRQGDDLGFKTSTFLSPDHLRKFVFPIYNEMAAIAHAQEKPFILHSCGNLETVYDDLIDDCKIDAKHSFEDIILPVGEFKKQYGERVTPLGGLDVDFICSKSPPELRTYTRQKIEACFYDGFWALGTGNSLTDYMPVENYVTVLEEAISVTG
ncbi:MAG: uroporphyrinogen-III decarboxylase-like protein [Calditrichaeota bacterium]|nr:MAG: uroporphyrinogen-III decarboxylase-like protein [Calditrichota bacterium]